MAGIPGARNGRIFAQIIPNMLDTRRYYPSPRIPIKFLNVYNVCVVEDWTAKRITRGETIQIMHLCEVMNFDTQDVLWKLAVRTFGIDRLSTKHR